MIIRYVELSGFKGIDQTTRIQLLHQDKSAKTFQDPLFLYKVIHGILLGFNEWQKEFFRGDPAKNRTFTGLISAYIDEQDILIERDFETNFVAFVLLQNEGFKTIYQGKDILLGDSHRVYLDSIKGFIPQFYDFLNRYFSSTATVYPETNPVLKMLDRAFSRSNAPQKPNAQRPTPTLRLYIPENRQQERTEKTILNYPYLFFEIFNKANKPIFLWAVNADNTPGPCILANKAACEMSGYSMDELKQRTFIDLKSPGYRSNMQKLLDELISKGQLYVEMENITKDGRVIPVSVDAHTFFIEGQRVILSVVEDISQRKLMEEKVQNSHEKYKALFDNARNAVLLLDKTQILECNPAMETFIGLPKNKIIGQKFENFCLQTIPDAENPKAKIKDYIQIVLAGGRKCFHCKFHRKDGHSIIGDVCLTPLRLQGKYYIQAIIHDLSEFYAIKEELHIRNVQFENLFRNALVGIWRMEFPEPIPTDLPAKEIALRILKTGKISECNQAFLDMYHVSDLKDIIGKTPEQVSVNIEKSIERLTEFVENRFIAEFRETSERDTDGKTRFFNNSFVGHVQNGKLHWMWGLQIEVTEKKKLEEQFLQSQKMEAIGMLAGGIAHDFNNILTVINGYSDILIRKMDADNPLLKYVTHIRRAGERASHLTKQLLSFSRKQVFQTKVINLNVVITNMISMIQRIIGEHIEIVTRLSSNLNAIKFDEGKLEQIIMNMIVNAKDAMGSGGKLFIETRNVYLDSDYCERHPEAKPGDYILLSIMDTGHGMSEEVLQHIFEPFFTTKEKGAGTGLGLATVYGIIKQANGHITVRSQEGQGTTFFLYFPKSEESKDDLTPEDHDWILLDDLKGSETILVVEDDETVRQVVVETLTNHGYHVIEAFNGQEALEIYALHADRIDLIITDVIMPQMNGKEFRRKILETNPYCKFIFMSGYTDTNVMDFGELDSVDFLQKPFKLTDLLHKLRLIFNKSSQPSFQ